jgi:cytochrome P450
MQALTLEVILRVVFGVSEGERLQRLRGLLRKLLAETSSPATQLLAMTTSRVGGASRVMAKFEGRMSEVDELLYAEIAEHRSRDDLADRDDILSALILARFEDGGSAERLSEASGGDEREGAKQDSGQGMTDTDLRDQLMTLLLAGHETTATALAWTFDLLLRHPAQMSRLRDSLEDGEEDYLRATITESLRLRPVVPLAGRRLATDLVADGLTLPAGTDVTPAIWLAHTREDSYPEPFAFRPERFLTDAPDTYSWIPFGGGVRRCIGGAFAEFEMRIVLREVLTRCELRKTDPAPERAARRNVTLSPRGGTRVVLSARHPVRDSEPLAA